MKENRKDRSKDQRIDIRTEVEYKIPKSDRPYLSSPILASGVYKGHRFKAIMSLGITPRAYVEVENPYRATEAKRLQSIHGGVTFIGQKVKGASPHRNPEATWFGWNYGHSGDYTPFPVSGERRKWTTAEIVDEIKTVIDELEK